MNVSRTLVLLAVPSLAIACSSVPIEPTAAPTTGPFQCGYELRGGNEGPFHNNVEVMAYGSDPQVCDQIARYFSPYQMPAFQPQSQDSSRVLVCKGKLRSSEVRIYDRHPFGDSPMMLCTTWLHGQWVATTAR
jgi:hypothetical protein